MYDVVHVHRTLQYTLLKSCGLCSKNCRSLYQLGPCSRMINNWPFPCTLWFAKLFLVHSSWEISIPILPTDEEIEAQRSTKNTQDHTASKQTSWEAAQPLWAPGLSPLPHPIHQTLLLPGQCVVWQPVLSLPFQASAAFLENPYWAKSGSTGSNKGFIFSSLLLNHILFKRLKSYKSPLKQSAPCC